MGAPIAVIQLCIRYRLGKKNANADGLSRQAWDVKDAANGICPKEGWGDVGLHLASVCIDVNINVSVDVSVN